MRETSGLYQIEAYQQPAQPLDRKYCSAHSVHHIMSCISQQVFFFVSEDAACLELFNERSDLRVFFGSPRQFIEQAEPPTPSAVEEAALLARVPDELLIPVETASTKKFAISPRCSSFSGHCG